ncbi:MAG: hypothetical protein HY318_11815, partial [Armatimonadetes bacterium]|nr:hypothetical protein [Armatimonadota bacterium]
VSNLAFLSWTESYTWGRQAARLMTQPHERLPDAWQFAWDADRQGETRGWSTPDLDAGGWLNITNKSTWAEQEVGRTWKAAHGADYTGVAWYRQTFPARPNADHAWLVFGAVAKACKVWVNGQLVLTRPYPIWGSPDSWQQPFAADASKSLRAGQPNVVVVRVESNDSPGGIWQPVWVVYPTSSATPD